MIGCADDLAETLHRRVLAGPDPDEAPTRLHRFIEAAEERAGGLQACVPDEAAADLLVLLLGQSPWAARELVREPHRFALLSADPYLRREKPEPLFHAARASACLEARGDDVATGLRRFRDDEYLRLVARELGLGRPEEVARELAALASACLDGAVEAAWAEMRARIGEPIVEDEGAAPHRCRFVVMGMGKLGAEELNFSSDIDLIYLYESDSGHAGSGSLHEYFARLAERVTRLVAGSGCFRVDLRLRPEGTRGPLVNALPAAERYYEAWARPWERQAWIKARAVAGDRDLGDEALQLLAPCVWPRTGVASAVEDVQAMMRKVRAELRDADDIKLGHGGIREVEFFVQALQRVHGGRRPELRERGTLRALDRLLFAGLVSEREHRALSDGYVLLRRVEHRLQLEELRQTHSLPPRDDRARRALLGRRLGFGTAEAFEERLEIRRAAVAAIYATLGREPEGPSAAVGVLLDPESDRAAIEAALRELGFRDVETSSDEMELLRGKPRSPFSPVATGAVARSAPLLLEEAAGSPDPDLALRRLVDLTARGAAAEVVFRLAGEAPAIGRLLVNLFGTSEFLSKILVAHPELVEQLVAGGGPSAPRDRDAHLAAIDRRLAESPSGRDDEEERLNVLRRYKHDELLRIGLRDVAGERTVDEVCVELSELACACLQATLDIVRPVVFRRYGDPHTPFAVVALGKLGGGELTYSSDLDLLFLFGGDDTASEGSRDPEVFEVMSRLAQRLIHGLGAILPAGRLYEVDTRLRPSGQQGALVSSLPGFARYHQKHAALWERQALIKARTVAGDPALGEAAETIARRHVWEGPPLDPAATAQEIGRLRARMEKELARETTGRFDIKLGRGGLLDVEFLVQYLQLVHGPSRPALRLRATRPALDALRREGLLDEAEHAGLDAGYRFLRRLENRMRIVHDRSISALRDDPVELDKLARRLGLHGGRPGALLLDEYHDRTSEIRRIYARWLPVPGAA